MSLLEVNALQAGMLLAQDIRNNHGTVILKRGTTIAERHIKGLKAWGISEVDIVTSEITPEGRGEEDSMAGEVIPVIEEKLKKRFHRFEGDAVMEEIYRVVRKLVLHEATATHKGDE
ncbi:MAG: hypothetical protein JXD19_02080 [Deltaproteobacteria bacterium]|nr:hypothetical protein [Deltaproteobacteria bacterium]